MSRLRGFGIFQLSLRILLVLVCFDIYSGLTGGNSFRDIAASIVCDFIGSPVAAISLLGISTFMVRLRKMNNKGIECSKIDET
jgi:phage-related holin